LIQYSVIYEPIEFQIPANANVFLNKKHLENIKTIKKVKKRDQKR